MNYIDDDIKGRSDYSPEDLNQAFLIKLKGVWFFLNQEDLKVMSSYEV